MRKLGPWWCNGTLIWGALWWCNGQIRDLSNDEIGTRDDLIGKLRTLDHIFFSNGLIRLNCALSNVWAPNFHWEMLDVMQEYMVALILHCSSYVSKIVWWLPIFEFGIFSHLLKLMGIHWMGPPSGYLKSSVLSFLFFMFFLFYSSFSVLFIYFFLSLSQGPL